MGNGRPVSEVHFGPGQLDGLIDALLLVPGLADAHARDARIADLRDALGRPLDPPRSPDARTDLAELVHTSVRYSGGLRALARIVREYHPGPASARFAALADDAIGPVLLSEPDRDALRALLTGLGIEHIGEGLSPLTGGSELYSIPVWTDKSTAIRMMERLTPPEDGVPQVLTFANRLAEVLGEPRASELRQWIGTVAAGLGVDATTLTVLRPGGEEPESAEAPESPMAVRRSDEPGLIWGGVPIRNRNFTGRTELLDQLARALQAGPTASVLPQALQGLGGVGKTQLVIEFVYLHLDQYDLVWWIPAEETATVLTSLTQLAERLGLATSEDRRQTARLVLDQLAGSDLAWLLIYDNATTPGDLEQLLPTTGTGGHVIVTTRDREWARVGVAIEVDVFKRDESVELLRNRSREGHLRFDPAEADELAYKLGDLPLALEQAAAWCLATAMPMREYIDLLDSHISDLMDEGKPSTYPLTVAAFISLAFERLRASGSPSDLATAQLLALFAYLGGEPVPQSLLRHGRDAEISQPLRGMLGEDIPMGRILRDLSRFGLAKVDPSRRIQVHRLVQLVIRDAFTPEQREETLRNVQNILATASPGDPDEQGGHERQREMGPHIGPADMIHSPNIAARQAVLDHSRYLYIAGDYENSRRLAEEASRQWTLDLSDPRLGPDGEMTLLARAQVANATRTLGDSTTAAAIAKDAYDRLQRSPLLGPRHEFTLITGNQIGADLRIAGHYREALEFDTRNVGLHREVFQPGTTYTLRAEANLAVDHRMIGQFTEALALDREIARTWGDVGGTDQRELFAYMNMARSFYGMGAYAAGLELLERWRSPLQEMVGVGHAQVLLAGRTYAITLRKAGRLAEASEVIQENQDRVHQRFGPNHEFSVAATVSYANLLRETGELDEALRQITDAIGRYKSNFGELHPLTLVALVDEAMIRRALGDLDTARELDAYCYDQLTMMFTADHPYTICAGTALATDLSRAGDDDGALQMSLQMFRRSRDAYGGGHEARDGADHPYVLMRAINLAHDMRATGAADDADALLRESLDGLSRALGSDHPEVVAAARGVRTEGDIEAPPT
jgi:tetratricopeptide (TPR) repeat protein